MKVVTAVHTLRHLVETAVVTRSFFPRKSNMVIKSKSWDLFKIKRNDKRDENIPSTLFSNSNTLERYITLCGLFLAAVCALVAPMTHEAIGEIVNMLSDRQHPGNKSSATVLLLPFFGGGRILTNASREERLQALVEEDAIACNYVIFGGYIIQLITLTLAIFMVKYASTQQASRIRCRLFSSIIRHDMAWYDLHASENFMGKLNEEVASIEEGIGEKFVFLAWFIMNIIFCFAMNFYISWGQTLVTGSLIPLTIIACALAVKWQTSAAKKENESDSEAGSIFTEVTSKIRTVLSFGGEQKERKRFEKQLSIIYKHAVRHGIATNIVVALNWMINVLCFAITFLNGLRLDYGEEPLYTMLTIFLNTWLIIARLVYVPSLVDKLITALVTSKNIFEDIQAKKGIDPLLNVGAKLTHMYGRIEFEKIDFYYPARSGVKVLDGVTAIIEPGELVAVVGSSGSGKSTLLQLLQRFYDPTSGSLLVDGSNMENLNVQWWRSNIGIVGQEASLFAGSIAENIQFGNLSANLNDVIEAAKKANAHDFISKLPKGYDTIIGSKGQTLSGGEKQRIAIARALIRNPNILLLDEPTSALDSVSREIVEKTLNDAAKNRTTIMVTHRLSTVRNADKIIVMHKGKVVEQGSYHHLLEKKGFLYNMVEAEEELKKSGDSVALQANGLIKKHDASETTEKPEDLKSEETLNNTSLRTILEWNRPDRSFTIIGFLCAFVAGVVMPICTMLYGDVFASFSLGDEEAIKSDMKIYLYCFLVMALVMFFVILTELTTFTIARERLSKRLRLQVFSTVLEQELGWFDDARNNVGTLYSKISQDVLAIHAATGPTIAMMFQAATMMFVGFVISFLLSWKLSLVATACLIPIFGSILIENFLQFKTIEKGDTTLLQASKIAMEAIQNKHVVTSFGLEQYFVDKFNAAVNRKSENLAGTLFIRGFITSFGQSGQCVCFGVSYWYGSHLVKNEDFPFENIVKVAQLILFGALLLATDFVFSPTISTAKSAASRVKALLERKSNISGGIRNDIPDLGDNEKIKYSQIKMCYPTRPESIVLRSVDLNIKEGQNVAVIGPSGSGKSSILYLLQRLYDPISGSICMNGTDIKTLTIPTLRLHLGLVSQEPVLFSGTISENIAYGDNSRKVSEIEIIEAARAADIHEFIMSLPKGYETLLGQTTQLSGGQKQRIAIARALIRNPKVLLLDEATSALDPEGERSVQRALDKASHGRTTITVAHRSGAVANADIIISLIGGETVDAKESITIQ